MHQEFKINSNLLEMKFPELQKLGADCIADIDHIELLISLRHMYLSIANDFCGPSSNAYEFDTGVLYCELAEKIQELIELGFN